MIYLIFFSDELKSVIYSVYNGISTHMFHKAAQLAGSREVLSSKELVSADVSEC
jgi:hypothetical protein